MVSETMVSSLEGASNIRDDERARLMGIPGPRSSRFRRYRACRWTPDRIVPGVGRILATGL